MREGACHQVVILGGGFGGLYAAQALGKSRSPGTAKVCVTLVDRRNFHLFQPLLYQVATGGLSPGDIASPLRAVLGARKNVRVLNAEAVDLDIHGRRVLLSEGELPYDSLVVATGSSHHYFGNDQWAEHAPGLKTVEDALEIRRRVLSAFEAAERESDPDVQRTWLRFVVVGGGPTGVELAGALGELTRHTLKADFRRIDPTRTEILLLEGMDRVLNTYPPDLSERATAHLARLGVTIRTGTLVTAISGKVVRVKSGDQEEEINAGTILWAAGMRAERMGRVLEGRAGALLDRAGRVRVEPDLTVPGHPELFVIGDLAHTPGKDGEPLPGVAPVAIQQGQHVARQIRDRVAGRPGSPFRYRDKGMLAVIGRDSAIADFGFLRLSGFPAWLVWVFVHIAYLIEFDNKLLVLIQWAWNYFTRNRGARLITGDQPLPPVQTPAELSEAERVGSLGD